MAKMGARGLVLHIRPNVAQEEGAPNAGFHNSKIIDVSSHDAKTCSSREAGVEGADRWVIENMFSGKTTPVVSSWSGRMGSKARALVIGTNSDDYEGVYCDDSYFEFWETNIAQFLLLPTALTSNTFECDLSRHGPYSIWDGSHLPSSDIRGIILEDYQDFGVEKFISRHGPTLVILELSSCSFTVGEVIGTNILLLMLGNGLISSPALNKHCIA
ncbi:hypothetical protein B0H34DRAFT_671778 [Crassisporium funariophilum]|nr:hypothetical protein B0H34DRAFT_671778 [Crassisporium funariophilum]